MVVGMFLAGFGAAHGKKLGTATTLGFALVLFAPYPEGREKVDAELAPIVPSGYPPELTLHRFLMTPARAEHNVIQIFGDTQNICHTFGRVFFVLILMYAVQSGSHAPQKEDAHMVMALP